VTSTLPVTFDPYDPLIQADPYQAYAELRMHAPLLRLRVPDVWLVSRYDDVAAALKDSATYSSSYGVAFGTQGGSTTLIASDPPDHSRLRRLLAQQFTPRSIAALEDDIRAEARRLIDALIGEPVIDLVDGFAAPLPTRVVARYLGIDPDRWRDYKRWSDLLNAYSWDADPAQRIGPQMVSVAMEAVGFFTAELATRRSRPRLDLIGRLAAAADHDALSDTEVISFCTLLMLAGNVTTTSLLSVGLLRLLEEPNQLQLLRADPSLIPAAVEELLRLESPIQGFARTLTRDVELHGQRMRAGEQVMLMFGSANRDESAFPDADRLNIVRPHNDHLAFGLGPHFCMGAWLARLEARIALEELLPRLHNAQIIPDDPPVRVSSPAFRELVRLPLMATWAEQHDPTPPARPVTPRPRRSTVLVAHGQGLQACDELLCHQTAETFSTVSQSDLAWTEKIWGVVSRRDGSMQLDVGLGKYHNRGVLDGFAGISRGVEQWTTRVSRDLWPDPERLAAGPLRYDVIEPMHRVRFQLDHTTVGDSRIAFDVVLTAATPALLEERDRKKDLGGLRTTSDLLRYHQCADPLGWLELDGVRQLIDPAGWTAVRDHSWGVRGDVGVPTPDLRTGYDASTLPLLYSWSPLLFTRPDGSRYELHHYVQLLADTPLYSSGHLVQTDGSLERVAVRPDLTFHPETRRLTGGRLHVSRTAGRTAGTVSIIDLTVIGQTGFHLGQGLYLGLDGQHHGSWQGGLRIDSENTPDCTDPAEVRRIHQLRDAVVSAQWQGPDGTDHGIGVHETLVGGAWPALGLSQQDAFL